MLKHTFKLSLIATTIVTGIAANAYAGDGKLTLEMLYHPNERVNFNSAPLTRLSWDNQNRLIESKVNKGVAELFVVNPSTWEKTALPTDGNIIAILKAAKIDDKEAAKLADQLGARIKPENKAYIFTYKNDIWLLDLAANKARELTHTPDQKEDEALLSPDTKQVAYLKGNDMYVTDVATAKETRLTTGGSEPVFNGRLDWVYQEEFYGRGDFRAFRWAPDSKKLAFLSFDETKVPVYTLSGDHAQPVKTDRTRYPKAGDPNPITKLGVVDLKGKVTWTHDPYPNQETLIVQVDWTPDGRLMASWQDRVQTWLDLRIYDAKYNSKAVVKETSPAWTERLPLPHFLKDGGFLWESSRTGHHHIYRYNKDFQLVNAITQGDWDVRAVHGVDEEKGRVLFAANERNPIGNDEYSIKLDGSEMKRLTEEKGTHMVRWNKTFTHYIDTWSSMTQTPKQALFTDAGAQVKLVDDPGLPAKYKELQLATMKHQQVKSRNGFLMESVLFLPPNFDATKKYPVYQHLYAGPMAPQVRDQWSTNLYYHFLAQQGYVVWVMDNQSASNKGVSSAWPIHKKLGQLELQDQLDGLEWLRQQGFADMDRIALNGWSYGGYFTSYAMTHSKAWKVGFVGAPVTDWRLYDSIYTERYMGLPKDNQEGYDKGSTLKAAKNLSGKILIMHGTMDDNVHPQNSIMFIDELAKGNKEYSLQLYPAQGHGVSDRWLNWSLQKAKWKFLQENL